MDRIRILSGSRAIVYELLPTSGNQPSVLVNSSEVEDCLLDGLNRIENVNWAYRDYGQFDVLISLDSDASVSRRLTLERISSCFAKYGYRLHELANAA